MVPFVEADVSSWSFLFRPRSGQLRGKEIRNEGETKGKERTNEKEPLPSSGGRLATLGVSVYTWSDPWNLFSEEFTRCTGTQTPNSGVHIHGTHVRLNLCDWRSLQSAAVRRSMHFLCGRIGPRPIFWFLKALFVLSHAAHLFYDSTKYSQIAVALQLIDTSGNSKKNWSAWRVNYFLSFLWSSSQVCFELFECV